MSHRSLRSSRRAWVCVVTMIGSDPVSGRRKSLPRSRWCCRRIRGTRRSIVTAGPPIAVSDSFRQYQGGTRSDSLLSQLGYRSWSRLGLAAIWMVEQNLADTRDNDTDQMFSNVGTFSKSHAAYRSPTAVQRALMTRRTASRKVHRVHLFMATDTGVLPWSPSENVVQDSASDVADSSALGHACRHPLTTLSRIRPHEMTSVMLAAVV